MENMDSVLTYINSKILTKKQVIGLLLERDIIDSQRASGLPVDRARAILKEASEEQRFNF
jgi:hypothetical protein